jgi:hypothetical protein
MGIYNVNCSISGLPITKGTEVRAFVLAETPLWVRGESASSPCSFYMPVTVGIFGKYDEAGGIKECRPSVAFDLAIENFFANYESRENMIGRLCEPDFHYLCLEDAETSL